MDPGSSTVLNIAGERAREGVELAIASWRRPSVQGSPMQTLVKVEFTADGVDKLRERVLPFPVRQSSLTRCALLRQISTELGCWPRKAA